MSDLMITDDQMTREGLTRTIDMPCVMGYCQEQTTPHAVTRMDLSLNGSWYAGHCRVCGGHKGGQLLMGSITLTDILYTA